MIGDTLKQRREAMGLDLREVSGSLKIRYDYLKALEDNVTGKLPEDVYTRGYIRGYARFLGIDPESLVEAYAAQRAAQDAVPDSQTSQPKRRSRITVIIPAAVVLGIVFLAVFAMLSGRRDHRNAGVSLPPPARHDRTALPEAPVPLQSTSGKDAMAPQESGLRYNLLVRADEAAWLRIEMDAGKFEEALLKPGETREWTSQNGFDLKVGNAGGIRLVLNGKDIETLGKKGQVVRIRLPKEESMDAALSR